MPTAYAPSTPLRCVQLPCFAWHRPVAGDPLASVLSLASPQLERRGLGVPQGSSVQGRSASPHHSQAALAKCFLSLSSFDFDGFAFLFLRHIGKCANAPPEQQSAVRVPLPAM